MATAAAAACAVLLGGCGGGAGPAPPAVSASSTASAVRPASSTRTATSTPAPAPATGPAPGARRRPRRRPGPSPGTLPQTSRLPSAHTHLFHREMAALWRGVETGKVRPALPAFFPEAAYVQVKSIGDPQADWRDRLVGDYRLDLQAARALVGGPARLVGVQVPPGYAHWIPPGVCDNRVGYFEVPNSRVLYRRAGRLQSFGIASMISWRGVWYVVHLGAVLRSADAGVVDAPSSGPGQAAPSSTC